jgi:hypothetical protein
MGPGKAFMGHNHIYYGVGERPITRVRPLCADVLLSNYSLTHPLIHSPTIKLNHHVSCGSLRPVGVDACEWQVDLMVAEGACTQPISSHSADQPHRS